MAPGSIPSSGSSGHGRKSPGAVPTGAQAVDVYFNEATSLAETDDVLRLRAVAAICQLLGPAPDPTFVECFRYERALALAPPGHYARMQTLRRNLPPRILLAGDYLAHLGVETAVVTGERAARDLHNTLTSPASPSSPGPSRLQ